MPPRARILVVDDEDLLRELAVDALHDAEFEVEQAGSGAEALAILSCRPFDLLFTDIRMPGMNGIELGRAAQRGNPSLRIVYASGYPGDAAGEETRAILLKPYRVPALIARIEEELATPRAVPSSSSSIMQLVMRGERLRARLEDERAIGEARRRQARATKSWSSRTRHMVVERRAADTETEPRFVAFYDRWLAVPHPGVDPERVAALDIAAGSVTLWRRDRADFECRFCGAEVDRQFGGNIGGGWLASLACFDPVATNAAYAEVIDTATPVLIERRLEGGIRNEELVLPLPGLRVPYLISTHLFASA
jgi:CheY-like chemotaxis protein